MPDPAWITPADLNQWSARRDSQARLPQLVRRLVFATIEAPHRNQFRAEEGVILPGWDGIVEVERGNQFVPDGQSVWELGTGQDPRDKANDDYKKRTEDPNGVDPSEACFVFATSRSFRDRDQWQEKKQKEGVWREVRAIDSDDLAQWLEIASSVRPWAARQMGIPSEGVSTVEDFWELWSATAQPILPPSAILAGRAEALDRFREWLLAPPSTLPILADSDEEALVFACASLMSLSGDTGDSARARSIVVGDEASWRTLVETRDRMIMLPEKIDSALTSIAARCGHHAILPVRTPAGSETLSLPPLHPEELTVQLEGLDLPRDRAAAIVRASGRRATILRRTMSAVPEAFVPTWAAPGEARPFVPLLLAGAWDDNQDADRPIVERLAGRPYRDVVDTITRWANEAEPPLSRTHDVWRWVSREDSWRHLARFIAGEDLRLFEEVALEVLGELDPANDLPPDERWMAGVKGARPRFSASLKEGLAETVALLGACSAEAGIQEALEPSTRALVVTRRLLHEKDWRTWSSLGGCLCHLAESSPDTFLAAVDNIADDQIRALFDQESEMGGAPHTWLLWALETFAWEPEYLARVTLILGRLARLDPGGRLANRPLRSLRMIFLGIFPQTRATLDQRLQSLDLLLERESDVGWELLMELMPRDERVISMSLHRPRWRDWVTGWSEGVTNGEYIECIGEVCSRAIAHAGVSGMRWGGIIDHLGVAWPVEMRGEAIESFGRACDNLAGTADALPAWNALRDLLHRHRSYPDAHWSMPADVLDQLAEFYAKLEPAAPLDRFGWLFTSWPNLPEPDRGDHRADEDARDEARERAARAILDAGGLALVLSMAPHVEQPHLLGWTVGALPDEEIESELLLRTLVSENIPLRSCGLGFVSGRFSKRGWDWADAYLSGGRGLDEGALSRFACALPFEVRVWDAVSAAGAPVESGYWSDVNAHRARDEDPSLIERSVLSLLAVGRPYSALYVAGSAIDRATGTSRIPTDLVARVLDEAARPNPEADLPGAQLSNLSYDIQRLFIALGKSDIDTARLARLEFAYLPALERSDYETRVLDRELATDPAFFAEVMKLVYRARCEDPEPLSEEDSARAQRAYELLLDWTLVPGSDPSGAVVRERLEEWVNEARRLCEESGRLAACDSVIGRVLAHTPIDPDGAWPATAVREVIENTRSDALEAGIHSGIVSKRGVYTKAYDEGGAQERALADQYETWARSTSDRYPRTAALLRMVAGSYRSDARRADGDADGRLQ